MLYRGVGRVELAPDKYGATCSIGSKRKKKEANSNRGELVLESTVNKVSPRLSKLRKRRELSTNIGV